MVDHHLDQKRFSLPHPKTLSRRFHIIMGKGGVGKSTVAMTLGLHYTRLGLRTLICEVDDREMMSHAFGVPPSRSEVRSLTDKLSVVSIDTQAALSEYGALKLRIKALASLLTENPLTRALISIVPGVADLIALGKAFNHERERDPEHPHLPRWDRVIIDAPSTGHGLTFLRLPLVIKEVVPSGNMRREADDMWSLISDLERTCIHVVSAPEDLPLQEAKELWLALKQDLGVQPQTLWFNHLESAPFDTKDWEEVRRQLSADQSTLWLYNLLSRRQVLGERQIEELRVLDSLQGARAYIPHFSVQSLSLLREAIAYALEAQSDHSSEQEERSP